METIEVSTPEKHIYQMIVPIRFNDPIRRNARSILYGLLLRPVPPTPEAEKERTLTFYPAVIANSSRIARECALLPNQIYEDAVASMSLLYEHQSRIVYIVAAALQNNHLEPDAKLIKFIERNLSGEELAEAFMASVAALNLEGFYKSILLVRPDVKIIPATQS